MRKMIDATPLIEWIERRGGFAAVWGRPEHGRHIDADVAVHLGPGDELAFRSQRRMWFNVKSSGLVSLAVADRWCVELLGINPALVFGPAWWDDEVAA